jgi:hypothetical protein
MRPSRRAVVAALAALAAVCSPAAAALAVSAEGVASVPVAAAASGSAAAPLVAPLAPLARYESLLALQASGARLDLAAVARPGIAFPVDGRLAIFQGSGRYEALRAGESADLFVPDGTALPAAAIAVERGVPGVLVRAANLLSSRGAQGSNPIVVEAAVAGRTFTRALVPRKDVDAPMSDALRDIEKLLARLRADPAAWDGARALVDSDGFGALSARERRDALRALADRGAR